MMLARLSSNVSCRNRIRLSHGFRRLSVGTKTYQVGQGGRLCVDMPKAAAIVQVTTQWKESCDITLSRLPAIGTITDENNTAAPGREELDLGATDFEIKVDQTLDKITVGHNPSWSGGDWAGAYLVEAVVPELFSVDLLVLHGHISVGRKLKGDCSIHLREGDIDVGVVRGENIRLSTGCGLATADEIEGNVDISASNVRARLINGAKVQIDAKGDGASVSVGGLYSSRAQISSTGPVAVSGSHGRITVRTTGSTGAVALSSVNGTAQVSTGEADAQVHVDSFEDGTSSTIRSDRGHIRMSISPTVSADIDIKGNVGELPLSFEGDIQQTTAVGTIEIDAAVMNPFKGSKSFGLNPSDAGGGKIDLAGARDQSLRQYFSNNSLGGKRPTLFATTAEGTVSLESLSWADNITRKMISRETGEEKKDFK